MYYSEQYIHKCHQYIGNMSEFLFICLEKRMVPAKPCTTNCLGVQRSEKKRTRVVEVVIKTRKVTLKSGIGFKNVELSLAL